MNTTFKRHGAIRYQEAQTILGERRLRTALHTGRLAQPWRGVVVPTTRLGDPATLAAAALLVAGPDAAIAGPTAARMWGCTAIDSPKIHVVVPYSRWVRGRDGLVVHHDRFRKEDIVELDGLPVMALEYVLAELLCTAPRRTSLACADQALAMLPADLRAEFRGKVGDRVWRRDDRRGTTMASTLLDLAEGRAESPPESWLRLLVVDAGFPPPVPQHEIHDLDGVLLCRLDLAWPELRIALEYEDGRQADAERDDRLAAHDWVTIRVRATDLRDPRTLIARLATEFRARGAAA